MRAASPLARALVAVTLAEDLVECCKDEDDEECNTFGIDFQISRINHVGFCLLSFNPQEILFKMLEICAQVVRWGTRPPLYVCISTINLIVV